MDQITGVPEGCRLGKRLNWKTNGNGTEEATFELVPVEQPKELVLVIPIGEVGHEVEVSIKSMVLRGITPDLADEFLDMYPGHVTIREKGSA